jgi:hypothetical protein
MLHRALMREEARPVVLGMAQSTGGHNPEENLLTSDSQDSALVTSDEEERGEPEKSRLCLQMVPVEANNIVQGLHTLYDWGSTVSLVRRESMRRLGFRPAQVAQRIVNGFGGAAVPITGCHFLPLIDVRGRTRDLSTGWIWERDWNLSGEGKVGHEAMEEAACDPLHGNAVSPILMCGLDGRTRKVKYEKFRQSCGVQPAACWEALKNGRLKIGEMEYPVTMNQTRSHIAGEEGCQGGCREQVRALERKIVQVLMEVLGLN